MVVRGSSIAWSWTYGKAFKGEALDFRAGIEGADGVAASGQCSRGDYACGGRRLNISASSIWRRRHTTVGASDWRIGGDPS